VDLAGTGPSLVLAAPRPNALAMTLTKSLPDSCVASCGSVLGWPGAEFAALARARGARELPRDCDCWTLRVSAAGPAGFWPAAVLPSAPGTLLVWPEPEAVAPLCWEPWFVCEFGSSAALAAGAPAARGAKDALAGIELPSVTGPVLIPT
jgi:hypothetical protein